MDRPTRIDVMMQIAQVISERSTCNRAQVGAVIAMESRIISTGYVGAPAGMPHCSSDSCSPDGPPCTRTVHAEVNAIAAAAKHGISVDGAVMYCTHSPCLHCAKLIINSGIEKVVFGVAYRDNSGELLLKEAGVVVYQGVS